MFSIEGKDRINKYVITWSVSSDGHMSLYCGTHWAEYDLADIHDLDERERCKEHFAATIATKSVNLLVVVR